MRKAKRRTWYARLVGPLQDRPYRFGCGVTVVHYHSGVFLSGFYGRFNLAMSV